MAVVKAGAYGADAPELARHLAAGGVDQFAVSHADEGVQLRRSGVTAPVLVLLATPDELAKARRAHLTVGVHSPELLRAVLADRRRSSRRPRRGRHGHAPHRAGARRRRRRARRAAAAAGVRVTGLMTHLSSADDPALDDVTRAQLADVRRRRRRASGRPGSPVPARHVLASAGVCRFPEHAMEMVRVGLVLHGIAPSAACGDAAAGAVADAHEPAHRPPRPRARRPRRLRRHVRGRSPARHRRRAARLPRRDLPLVPGRRGRRRRRATAARSSGASRWTRWSSTSRLPRRGRRHRRPRVRRGRASRRRTSRTSPRRWARSPYEVIARLGPRVQRVFVRH